MDHSILEWLLEEENPEVRLRTLKEYEKLPEEQKTAAAKQGLRARIEKAPVGQALGQI